MDNFGIREVRELTANREGPCITIFMPTHAAGRDGQQDALRLKNLVSQAECSLIDQGIRGPDAKSLLAPVRDLPAEPGFWEKREKGLAVFLSEGLCNRYRVPLDLEETVIVKRRFQIKPLLPLLATNDQFFLLAISQNRVRFFVGRRYSIRAVTVEGLPDNMEHALNIDSADRGSQVHSAMRGDLGKQAAVFHGHGGERDAAKDDLARYFRLIDGALHRELRDQHAPLILAGVQYLLPIYREVSSYAHIVDSELPGNPDHLHERELHRRAWPLVETHVEKTRQEAIAKYGKLAGTGKTANDVRHIVPAAYQGQVETLFVDRSSHEWGLYDPTTSQVQLRSPQHPGDDDLLDYAAVQTLLHRGSVYAVAPDQSPSPPIAAVFRY